jgi:hypothetical protein
VPVHPPRDRIADPWHPPHDSATPGSASVRVEVSFHPVNLRAAIDRPLNCQLHLPTSSSLSLLHINNFLFSDASLSLEHRHRIVICRNWHNAAPFVSITATFIHRARLRSPDVCSPAVASPCREQPPATPPKHVVTSCASWLPP